MELDDFKKLSFEDKTIYLLRRERHMRMRDTLLTCSIFLIGSLFVVSTLIGLFRSGLKAVLFTLVGGIMFLVLYYIFDNRILNRLRELNEDIL